MKYLNFRFLILLIIISVSFFFIYSSFFKEEKKYQNSSLEIEENNLTNSNIIKDIKYSSKDLKGNEYVILADEGEIDLVNSDIIFKNVKAYINLIENNEMITVISKFGSTISKLTQFSLKMLKLNTK